jgi:hypothetical protein
MLLISDGSIKHRARKIASGKAGKVEKFRHGAATPGSEVLPMPERWRKSSGGKLLALGRQIGSIGLLGGRGQRPIDIHPRRNESQRTLPDNKPGGIGMPSH